MGVSRQAADQVGLWRLDRVYVNHARRLWVKPHYHGVPLQGRYSMSLPEDRLLLVRVAVVYSRS